MTNKILFVTFLSFAFLAGCDDDPFIHFKPSKEAPILGKDDQKKDDLEPDREGVANE